MRRIRCRLFGCCCEHAEDWQCYRCGTWADNSEWLNGWLWSVWYKVDLFSRVSLWWWLTTHPCETCGKRMWFSRDHCCGEKCYVGWIPF